MLTHGMFAVAGYYMCQYYKGHYYTDDGATTCNKAKYTIVRDLGIEYGDRKDAIRCQQKN